LGSPNTQLRDFNPAYDRSWDGPAVLQPRQIKAAKKRLHHNVLAIALANKLARIAWSVLARGRAFEASKLQVA
jgi:hypothetical protein